MVDIHLTFRFLEDLEEIYQFSIAEWDERTADNYLTDIEHSLALIGQNPKILVKRPLISSRFFAYPINKHWLICEVLEDQIFALTLLHSSLNMLERLQKFEPTLEEEIKVLSQHLKKK